MDEKTINQKLKEGWMRIMMIQEIAGFPEKHVIESMDVMNDKLVHMPSVEVLDRKVHETKEVTQGVWSMFAEIELLVEDFPTLLLVIMDFMPSSVEIIAPLDKITFEVGELTGAINDIIGKLHHLDATSKKYFAAAKVLERKLNEQKPKQ